MLEYNADTPSLLLETGWVSKSWYSSKHGYNQNYHQSNYIEEVLPKAVKYLTERCRRIGIVAYDDDDESFGQTLYI